jgi:transcriptional regulator CBF1
LYVYVSENHRLLSSARIMAEVSADHADLGSGLTNSPGHKRKRGMADTSPGDRRSKRGAPVAAMAPAPDPTSFIENAVEAAQAAGVNVADFSALQQASTDHSEAADPANASSTAAAALGSMYPTLHVPQSTEETFAAQSVGDDHQDSSYKLDVTHPDGLPDMSGANGVRGPDSIFKPTNPGGPKPTVGSEEWHKMRKDNHKEGMLAQ